MIEDDLAQLLLDQAASVGRRFARQYPSIDADDIAAEITRYALDNWGSFERAMARAREYGKQPKDTLRFFLSQRASTYCGAEHYAYIVNTSHVIYTPKEVRAILRETYFNPDTWDTPSKDTQLGQALELRSVWANHADIKAALARVSAKAHDIILAAYGPIDLGLPTPDKRRVSDAIDVLTRELNRHLNTLGNKHQGPGSRRAMSNAEANYLTNSQEH
ncbi:hypothetical protein ACIBG8_19500 [Nonomuraea sp. NPDC050556]|uniref:hypothetical protein n=1 Tax=Nonomuraea sp. NPDC050556 TaxID=3364369 RepID=UPI0037A4BBCA